MAVATRYYRELPGLIALAVLALVLTVGLRWLGYIELRVFADRIRHNLFRPRRRGLPSLLAMAHGEQLVRKASRQNLGTSQLSALLQKVAEASEVALLVLEPGPELAAEWGQHPAPCARNPLAIEYLDRGPPHGATVPFILASTPPPTAERPQAAVRYDLPLPRSDGSLCRLICGLYHDPRVGPPSGEDVYRYLGDPLANLLHRLSAQQAARPRLP